MQAIFAAGMPEYDQNYSLIGIDNAAFFSSYQDDEADYIEVKPSPERSTKSYYANP